MFSLSSLA
jgi:hypothetical protein